MKIVRNSTENKISIEIDVEDIYIYIYTHTDCHTKLLDLAPYWTSFQIGLGSIVFDIGLAYMWPIQCVRVKRRVWNYPHNHAALIRAILPTSLSESLSSLKLNF